MDSIIFVSALGLSVSVQFVYKYFCTTGYKWCKGMCRCMAGLATPQHSIIMANANQTKKMKVQT